MSSWDDLDVAATDLAAVAAEVVDPDAPTVLAGFSQGGGVAARLALAGEPIAARGCVAVAPSFFRHGLTPADIASLLPGAAQSGVRAWFAIGGRDGRYRPRAEEVAAALDRSGVAVRWRVFDDLGHDYPAPFDAHLSEAVDFLLAATSSISP